MRRGWRLVVALSLIGVTPVDPAWSQERAPTRTIGVVVFDGVLTSDVVAPLEVLGKAVRKDLLPGYRVVTVAAERKPIETEEGISLVPDHDFESAPALDVLVVGSAYDMKRVLSDEALIRFVERQGSHASWIASNCSGAHVLGRAGLLDGKRVTTYPGGEVLLKARNPAANVEWGTPVVVDRGIVSSNGGLVSYAAALRLLEALAGPAQAEEVAADLHLDRLVAARSDAEGGGEQR